jgi:hypothetical protein
MNIQPEKVKDLPAYLQVPVTPKGMISAQNLAEIAGCSAGKVRWRCQQSGVDQVYVRRVNINGDGIGGRMICFPKDAALEAVLGKEE